MTLTVRKGVLDRPYQDIMSPIFQGNPPNGSVRVAQHRDQQNRAIRLRPRQHFLAVSAPVLIALYVVRAPRCSPRKPVKRAGTSRPHPGRGHGYVGIRRPCSSRL